MGHRRTGLRNPLWPWGRVVEDDLAEKAWVHLVRRHEFVGRAMWRPRMKMNPKTCADGESSCPGKSHCFGTVPVRESVHEGRKDHKRLTAGDGELRTVCRSSSDRGRERARRLVTCPPGDMASATSAAWTSLNSRWDDFALDSLCSEKSAPLRGLVYSQPESSSSRPKSSGDLLRSR